MGVSPDTFTLDDFTVNEGATANQATLVEGEWMVSYFKEFERGEAWALGRGLDEAPDKAQGRIFAEFTDASGTTFTDAKMKFAVMTLNNEVIRTIGAFDLSEVNAGESDRSSRRAFPIQEVNRDNRPPAHFKGHGRRLGILIKPRAGSGITEVDDSQADTSAKIEGYEWSEGR